MINKQCLDSYEVQPIRKSPSTGSLPNATRPHIVHGSPTLGQLPGQYLFSEYVKVESQLKIEYPELKHSHVRYYHLPGTVERIPCGKYQIRISIMYLTRLIMWTHSLFYGSLPSLYRIFLFKIELT